MSVCMRGIKMVQLLKSRLLSAAVICVTMFGMLASPVAAQLVTGRSMDFEPGVSATGTQDFVEGDVCEHRDFKYTRLRIIVTLVRGRVTNRSGRPAVFRNPGQLRITDPQTGVQQGAIQDLYVYSRNAGPGACLVVANGWRPE